MSRAIALLIFCLFPVTCQAQKITVVASFSILADMAHEVAGDDIVLKTLVGPDSDAHIYEPTPADIRALHDADLILVNGLGFEGWLTRLTESSGFRGKVVVATRGVTAIMHGTAPDPHAWQSIGNGEIYVGNIRDALMKAAPKHAGAYAANAEKYLRELAALDGWVRAEIAHVPPQKRRAITSHDALGYFAQSYGVHFIAPLGVSTGGDVSARDIAGLVDQIRKQHVRAVFMENMSDPRLMRQLARDGGAVIGGVLYSDALSSPDGKAPSYMALFRHNVTMLTDAMLKN